MPVFNGTEGPDSLVGGNADDTFTGLGGKDRIITQDGNDTVDGGEGDDEINGFGTFSSFSFFAGSGNKVLRGGNGNDFVAGGSGSDVIGGDAGDDVLIGRAGSDSLDGGAGNDSIDGGEGNDTLRGGAGVDSLRGGSGDDTYEITDATDAVMDSSGNDRMIVSVDFVKVPTSIESVTYLNGALALPYWIDALLDDADNGGQLLQYLGSARTYNYFFPTALPAYDTFAADGVNWTAFNAADRTAALAVFELYSSVLDLRFAAGTEAAGPNTLTLQRNNQNGSAGFAYSPSQTSLGSDVFIANSTPTLAEATPGAGTLVHEIAHAIGLKHPHANGTPSSEPPYLTTAEDTRQWTVMSYTQLSETVYWRYRLGDLDIAALQYLYGPSRAARAGDDTYTLSESAPNFIWDGAGTDTIDASALTRATTLFLAPGYWGFVGAAKSALITAAGQVTVNFGSSIENARGSAFADRVVGSDLANRLDGNAGADTLEGGTGDDTITGGAGNDSILGGAGADVAMFTGARADYTITYASSGTYTVTDNTSGRDGADALRDVEQFRFSDRSVSTASLALELSERTDLLLAVGVHRGLNGNAATPSNYGQIVSSLGSGNASSFALSVGAAFAAQSGETFTSSVMSNFGITTSALGGASPSASFEALKGALVQIFTLFAPARGQVVLNMTTLLQGLEADAVFGQVARTWNARVGSDLRALSGTALVDASDIALTLVGVPDLA